MKTFFRNLGKNILMQIVSLFVILAGGGIVFAIMNWPSDAPAGEVAGGKFMNYFNNMFGTANQCGGDQAIKGFDDSGNAVCGATGGGGIGDGQTWHQFKNTERLPNVHYINDHGRAMALSVMLSCGSTHSQNYIYVDDIPLCQCYGSQSGFQESCLTVIPNGSTYWLSYNMQATYGNWAELY